MPSDTEPVPDNAYVLIHGWNGAPARLYRHPREVVVARRIDEVEGALARIEALTTGGAGHGCHLAGYLAYEAGLALEPRLAAGAAARIGADGRLVWFGVFDTVELLDDVGVADWLAAQAGAGPQNGIGPLTPMLSPGGHARAVADLQEAIAAGDIYQANLTFPLAGAWRGSPAGIHAALWRAAGGGICNGARMAGGHGALVHDGAAWLLSLSPELFVAMDGEAVTVKPMKGTAARGSDGPSDAAAVAALSASAKDRAENLMIVDLLRNDVSRVARAGSVRVEDAFAVETYPSLHQMVSTIRARLLPGAGVVDMLRALFPCGSITGAPKLRAMELIAQVERQPRGVYCGAIGWFAPGNVGAVGGVGAGRAEFNVAIRTLRLTPDGSGRLTAEAPGAARGRAVLGVGSAITAGSEPLAEWRECLVKGGFVSQPAMASQGGSRNAAGWETGAAAVADFDLIETMRFDPETGVERLDLHLVRLAASAAALGFSYDRHALRNAIHALCFAEATPGRLRLCLSRGGAHSLELGPLPLPAVEPMACVVLALPVDPGDWRLRHKTSDRDFYERGRRAARGVGADEALFVRDDGLLTEGCFTSLFVARAHVSGARLLTPPVRLGLLPGVLRASLLADGRAVEADLNLDDLAGEFWVGNALRGLMRARLWNAEAP